MRHTIRCHRETLLEDDLVEHAAVRRKPSLAAITGSLVTRAGSRIPTASSGDSDCEYATLSLTWVPLHLRDTHSVFNE
jgi:hypothetical protein